MTSFTPGEWRYDSGAVWSCLPDGMWVRVAMRDSNARIPATEKDANMRLCATAPGLLKLIQVLLDNAEVDALNEHEEDNPELYWAIDNANALLDLLGVER